MGWESYYTLPLNGFLISELLCSVYVYPLPLLVKLKNSFYSRLRVETSLVVGFTHSLSLSHYEWLLYSLEPGTDYGRSRGLSLTVHSPELGVGGYRSWERSEGPRESRGRDGCPFWCPGSFLKEEGWVLGRRRKRGVRVSGSGQNGLEVPSRKRSPGQEGSSGWGTPEILTCQEQVSLT